MYFVPILLFFLEGSMAMLTSSQLQSLMGNSYSYHGSPKRISAPIILSPSASSTISRYGLPSGGHGNGGHNPSVVAIPLYVRNGANGLQRTSSSPSASQSVYDILGSTVNDRFRYPVASSNKHLSYSSYSAVPKKVVSPVETYARYTEKQPSYSKYDNPKTASSTYDPIRYELTKSEPGYGDASAVSLLSTGYRGSQGSGAQSGYSGSGMSLGYTSSSRAQPSHQAQVPRLRAIEYDDNQKAALADFASALENFELKSIKSEDVYDIPPIQPPSGSSQSNYGGSSSGASYGSPVRLAVVKKQEAVRQAVAAAVDRGNDGGYGGQSSYGKSQSSYDAQPSSSYDDRSYDRQPSGSYGQSGNTGDYASATSSDSYRSPVSVVDKYRSAAAVEVPESRYRQAERVVDDYRDSYRAAADPYRSVERNVDNYRQEEPAYDNQDSYAQRQPASSSDYYGSASSRQVDPNDPNCPYEDKYAPVSASPSSSYGSTSKLAAAISAAKAESAAASGYDRVVSVGGQEYGQSGSQSGGSANDELDPSKLDLKIVHLPVSVLKRLVGSGELALPSFQKKKK